MGLADLVISSDGVKYGTFNAEWLEKQAVRWQRKYARRRYLAQCEVWKWNHNRFDHLEELDDYSNWQRARAVAVITTWPGQLPMQAGINSAQCWNTSAPGTADN